MITANLIALSVLGIVFGLFAMFLLVCGIYDAIKDKDMFFCIEMAVCFLFASCMSAFILHGTYKEYQDAIPQNQVKILKQKISDAEKELQKYLMDHPELKEVE